jgi:hypothetical protein
MGLFGSVPGRTGKTKSQDDLPWVDAKKIVYSPLVMYKNTV